MNIIDAIKSGKRFRRIGKDQWNVNFDWMGKFQPPPHSLVFSYSELLADDWEIEEKHVEVTASQIAQAIRMQPVGTHCEYIVSGVLKELGLEE